MITYDGLRVLMMAEDDSRCCFGLYGPLLHPYIVKEKPIWVVFQGACDGNARIGRNISQKSKNNEKLDFQKIDFLNFFSSGSMPRCIFWMFPPPENFETNSKTQFLKISRKL